MLDKDIQQLRLYNYNHRIFDQCNELAKKDQNDASSAEKPDWWSLFDKAKWSKLTKNAWYTGAEPKRESKKTLSNEILPPNDENTFKAELRAAQSSTHRYTYESDLLGQLVDGQCLNVIKNLALEKQ